MKIILHFMQAVCKGWYFCKYHEKWKGGRKLAVKPWKMLQLIEWRMWSITFCLIITFFCYSSVRVATKTIGLGSRLTPDFCDEKSLGAQLRWHDPDTEKISAFCDFDCRDKKRHNGKLCDIRMKCNVVICIQNPMLRTEYILASGSHRSKHDTHNTRLILCRVLEDLTSPCVKRKVGRGSPCLGAVASFVPS